MAKVPTPQENQHPRLHHKPTSPKAKLIYCILCRRTYLKHEAHEHMHSMLHHRELETVLGKGSFHECHACKLSSVSLNVYAQHISTAQHKAKLKSLMSKNVKPPTLCKTVSAEAMARILERNKTLKKAEKKKKRKKRKQDVRHNNAKLLQGAARKNTVVSRVNMRMLKQRRGTHQAGSNNAAVKNKENKVSSLQRPLSQRESALRNQSSRSACSSGEPAPQTRHHPNFRDQFARSAHQLRYEGNYSVNKQCSEVQSVSTQTDGLVGRPHISVQRGATNTAVQMTINDCYSKQYDRDFTSNNLPQNGAIIFDHGWDESTGSSQLGREGSRSAQPDPADRSVNAAPIRDIDVSAMLWQIRRALGVREPCRADREARRQSGEGGAPVADHRDHAGPEREQPAGGSFRNHAKEATLRITSAATASSQCSLPTGQQLPNKPKQTAVGGTPGTTRHCEKSSAAASDSNGPSSSRDAESPPSLSRCLGRTTSSEPNLSRIAPRSGTFQGENEGGLKLTSLSGAKSEMSWREMYEEMKRKKLGRVKGGPRFGIELANPPYNRESATRAEDSDLPLSEGFHWESLPECLSGTPCSPPRDATVNDSCAETRPEPLVPEPPVPEPLEQPGAAQEGRVVSMKVEPNSDDVKGDSRDGSSASKRKHDVVTFDGTSEKEASGKKKKKKSNKDQDKMDHLLAVSLREEELSLSLEDLDNSLVQARNALQAAYTEVQRLLLLRQQCTAEVNSLRAQRIEILQEMQDGYSGASNVAEKASPYSAGAAAAALQPRLSPLPPSVAFPTPASQQSPPTNPASSISQPHSAPLAVPKMSLKQEICQPPAVSCNPDTPHGPGTPPVPLFPTYVFPSLLVTSPRLAAPATAVTAVKQLKTACPISPITIPSPGSSARQQAHLVREGSKDFVRLASDSVEETGGNLGKEPAAREPDGGNESDSSVEVMEPSNLVVIDVDESDNEGTVSNVPVHQEPPQKSVIVEISSSSTQTFQQNYVPRKVEPALVQVKEAPPESIEVVADEEPSVGAFVNHTGPVHDLQVHEGRMYTCSGDNTARSYSLKNRECQAVFDGHTNKINCLLVSSLPNKLARLYTGSSDQTIRCYSTKSQKCLEQISLSDRVLCLHSAWNTLFAGLANGSVASYELNTLKQLDVFDCHGPRGVSCLGTAQEGARRVLLVGSYDSTISVRDARSGLLLRSLEGHNKTVLCMKVVNDLVFSGSSDTSVHAHNIHTGELVRIYKGHGHAVTSIVILGKVMVTACLDKLVRVYELQSHDRLQVYGGHSDMVMCMAVHKSVVYTGCYDGSVQAVKLNLMKNHRCWWQNCSLIFGMAEHLVQHLVGHHTNPNLQAVRCRWRGCNTFFATTQSVRQELPEHMQSHVENDSEVQP